MQKCQVDVTSIVWAEPGLQRSSFVYFRGLVSPEPGGKEERRLQGENVLAFRLRYRFEKTARVPTRTAMYTRGAISDNLLIAAEDVKEINQAAMFLCISPV